MRASRRTLLRAAGAVALLPTASLPLQAAAGTRLAASWRDAGQNAWLGVLAARGARLAIAASLALPGRAHGLSQVAGGSLLAVARRPGDWLLRWHPLRGTPQWQWIEPDRAFTGHVIASADGRRLYTPETDLATGQGLVGVRDAASLAKLAEWPTHGQDPHALLLDRDGELVVANGGIATQAESGRRKLDADRMDASLVRLAARDGALRGQWRLADARLSIRHLAWGRRSLQGPALLGIALQAEHDDPQARAGAPTLALFDGTALRPADPGHAADAGAPLAGYGGDIAATEDGFAVSCPRAAGGGVGLWAADGGWRGFVPLAEACALAGADGSPAPLWFGGRRAAVALATARTPLALPDIQLDNHWIALA